MRDVLLTVQYTCSLTRKAGSRPAGSRHPSGIHEQICVSCYTCCLFCSTTQMVGDCTSLNYQPGIGIEVHGSILGTEEGPVTGAVAAMKRIEATCKTAWPRSTQLWKTLAAQ